MRNVMTLALVALSLAFVGCDKKDDVKETKIQNNRCH